MSKFYITTAIPYASGRPHIGNTFEAIFTDCIARYHKLIGDDVFMLTGMDEHGQKIQKMAEEQGITPQALVDKNTSALRSNWDLCNVEYDDFIRTTDERHKKIVQKIFRKLYDQGDIYLGKYEGWYCVPDEAFFTDTQVVDDKIANRKVCPECGRPVEKASEDAYFFALSRYNDKLKEHIEKHPDFIMPEQRKNEMLNSYLSGGLQDFCVSRTSFSWGIPVDFDPKHVMYVWVDALSNYITALGYDPDCPSQKFNKYWACDVHIIGKDILRFHTLYWPAMLMALGVELPKHVFAHPWFLMGEDKMSKSLGNIIYAEELCENYGVDKTRYYCLREMPYAQDGSITREQFASRTNSDLANNLGNLVSRTIAMGEKYFSGDIKNPNIKDEYTDELAMLYDNTLIRYEENMKIFAVQNALAEVFKLLDRTNLYIDQTMPWKLAKETDKANELQLVLYTLCNILQKVSVLLYPAMPDSMLKLRSAIGVTEKPSWGETIEDAYNLTKIDSLFPRVE